MTAENFLSKVSIFKDLDEKDLERIDFLIETKLFKKGEAIIHEGDDSEEFYIVEKGRVAVNKNVAGGRRRNLANFKAGEVFGELAMFDEEPRSASAEATENTTVAIFKIDAFKKLMEEEAGMANKIQGQIIKTLCERLRNTNELLNEGAIWGFKMVV